MGIVVGIAYTDWTGYLLPVLCILWMGFLLFPFLMNIPASMIRLRFSGAEEERSDFACVITAFRNIDIALPLAESLLSQDYSRFRVYLVADACPNPGTDWYDVLHDPRFTLLRPEDALGSKVASLRYARERFIRQHDTVVVFDPDNLAATDFLRRLEGVLQRGFSAVQGRRTAKNLDSAIAVADATGELYKNFIEREVPTRLGSSASIAGSGMAIRTSLFDEYLASPRIAGPLSRGAVIAAEDKILQNFLVSKGFRIPFCRSAILYDEKVETAEQVERQRTRWTYSYFENIPFASGQVLRGLIGLNRNRLLFGIYTLIPPIFLLLSGTMLLSGIMLLVEWPWALALLAAAAVFVFNIAWSLYLNDAPPVVWQTLRGLPVFAWNQMRGVLRLGRARQDFLVTEKRRAMRLEDVQQEKPGEGSGAGG